MTQTSAPDFLHDSVSLSLLHQVRSRITFRILVYGGLGIALVLRVVLAIWVPFTDTTEARYGEIARVMVETGDWVTPWFDDGVPFWGKPPLHTWLSAAGMKLFGISEFGARFFILVVSVFCLGVIGKWAALRRGSDVALVAVLICALSLYYFGASAFVMTDMPMVLGLVMSMIGFYEASRGGSAARMWGYLFFAGLAVGLLAKGPTAVVLTGLALTPWLLLGGRWRRLAHLPWVSGLVLTISLAAPWYILAELSTPGFLRYFLIGEHIERFLVPGWAGDLYGVGHERAKGMIWAYAPGVFLPWTPLAIALLVMRPRAVRAAFAEDDWLSYLGFWVLAPLILFTPSANILAAYLLPALPAASLLLAVLWVQIFGLSSRLSRLSLLLPACLALGIYATLAALPVVAPDRIRLKTLRPMVSAIAEIAPNAVLTTFPDRRFSAEFYTTGRAESQSDLTALAALMSNDRLDAVAVRRDYLRRATASLTPGFRNAGTFGRYVLFLERPNLSNKGIGQ